MNVPARAGSTVCALALAGALSLGLTIGACEPLDIALYPPTPDAGVIQPVDVNPPERQELPDAASSPAPVAPDARSPSPPRPPCLRPR